MYFYFIGLCNILLNYVMAVPCTSGINRLHTHLGDELQQCEFPKCNLLALRIQLVVDMVQCIYYGDGEHCFTPVSWLNRNHLSKLLLYFEEVFHV